MPYGQQAVTRLAPSSINEVNYDQYAGPPDGSANDPVLEQPWINIWIGDALQAAGLPVTEDWLNGFLTLCNRESSYMPRRGKHDG